LNSIGYKLSKRGRLLSSRRKIKKCGSSCMAREKPIKIRMVQTLKEMPLQMNKSLAEKSLKKQL